MRHAFAPAHVTGLFAVHDDHADPAGRGSRGAGWCINQGAWASVEEADAVEAQVDGRPAPVTQAALKRLADEGDAAVSASIHLDLPTGQGFGMSAAGTLAACLAACDVLDLEPEAALTATHLAEVEAGSGLGDAMGSWLGGGEVRLAPGIPPFGTAMRIEPGDQEFLFCVLGDAVPTSRIITDPAWKQRTKDWGDGAVDRILEAGREHAWSTLLRESSVFSTMLGLMPERMEQLGGKLPEDARWGQVMLGSTMWVTGDPGDLQRAEAVLEQEGQVIRARPDVHGARLVRSVLHS